MRHLDRCIMDLNKRIDKAGYSADRAALLKAVDNLKEMQVLKNAHELEMTRIKANRKNMVDVMDRLLNWLIHGKQNE